MGRRRVDGANLGNPRSLRGSNGRARSGNGNGNLTNHQRKIICEFYQRSGGVMSQKDLAQWTKHEFGLKKTPAQSTISGILRRRHEFINMSALELNIKKRRVVQHPLLDNALANWVIHCAHRGETVQGDMTKEKAKQFARMLNIPEDEQPEFSNGWLHSFQLRHNFSFRKFNGENRVDSKKVMYFSTMDALVAQTSKYELQNIFCMEETVLLYKAPPTQSVVDPWSMKKRVVTLLCTNANASERLDPLFVSHLAKPTCFQKKAAQQHELHYFWNSKAWMTGMIFTRWIQRLDAAMGAQKRRILLLMTDAASHMVAHLDLSHIVIYFLPSAAATTLLPLRAGILTIFKKRYRQCHFQRASKRASSQKKNIFDVDVLHAMKWAVDCWQAIKPETIQSCWVATQIVPGRIMGVEYPSHEDHALSAELEQQIATLPLGTDPVPMEIYLNDEARCEEPLHEGYFDVIQPPEEIPDDEVDPSDDEASKAQLSPRGQLKAVQDVLQYLQKRNKHEMVSKIRQLEDELRSEIGGAHTTGVMNAQAEVAARAQATVQAIARQETGMDNAPPNNDSLASHEMNSFSQNMGVSMGMQLTMDMNQASGSASTMSVPMMNHVAMDSTSSQPAVAPPHHETMEGEFHAVI